MKRTQIKTKRKPLTKIQASAKGETCQIRLPGICNGNPETTVLCHLPGAGMGIKSYDIHAAYGCSSCHDEVDRRSRYLESEFVRACFHEAIISTQIKLTEKGLLSWET